MHRGSTIISYYSLDNSLHVFPFYLGIAHTYIHPQLIASLITLIDAQPPSTKAAPQHFLLIKF